MSDKLQMFDEETPEIETQEPEITPEPEASEPETGEPEPEKAKEEVAPPAAPEKDREPVPIQALLDERERRQKAEREAEELRRWRAEQEARAQQGRKPPDFFENPDQAVQQAVMSAKLEQSRFLAEREFGQEVVREAFEYFNQHPQESQQLLRHPSPFHAAVDVYKRAKLAEEIGGDPEKWRQSQIEAIREQLREELKAEMQPGRPKPPASLSGAPAAAGPEPVAVKAPPALSGLFGG